MNNKCQCCKREKYPSHEEIRYYERYDLVLCNMCVDKIDGTWNMRLIDSVGVDEEVIYPFKKTEEYKALKKWVEGRKELRKLNYNIGV